MSGKIALASIYGGKLIPVDKVIKLIAAELDPKKISEFSKAIEAAKKVDGDNLQRKNYWGELSIWSRRRLGQLIAEGQKAGEIKSKTGPSCSHDASISPDDIADKDTRSRAKQIAAVDEDTVREYVEQAKESGDEVTLTGLVKYAKNPHVSNNSGEQEWYTPPEYIAAAKEDLMTLCAECHNRLHDYDSVRISFPASVCKEIFDRLEESAGEDR